MRFAIITDTHYSVKKDTEDGTLWNKQLLTLSLELGVALRDQLNTLNLDMVLHCGDLTHDGDIESLIFCAELFKDLRCPVYFTLGNHDTLIPAAREEIASIFKLPTNNFSFRHDLPEFSLLFLDTNFAHYPNGREDPLMNWRIASKEYSAVGPTRSSIIWLDQQLKDLLGTPVIIIAHHPFITKETYPRISPRSLSDWRQRVQTVDTALFPAFSAELRDVISSHSKTISAIFSGHWHINDFFKWNDIAIIQTSSLIEFPFEFRVFELTSDSKLIGKTEKLVIPKLLLDELSLVPEWGNDWLRGTSVDREIEISVLKDITIG